MRIKTDNLVKGISEPVYCEGNVVLPKNISNNLAFVKINGSITNTDEGKYFFDGYADVILNLNCDSCLKPFEYKLKFNINEVYTKNDNPDDEELYFNKIIDLEPAVKSNIILNMPMRTVCSENCKGLCHICGHNLNDSDCGCERSYIDPRLEMLRSYNIDKSIEN